MHAVQKSNIRPGDRLKNVRSERTGVALPDEKDSTKLSDRCHEDYVHVLVVGKGKPAEARWYVPNVEKLK